MNRIYKVIWNEALNCFTAVGEYAKARGKSSKSSVSANATINTTSNASSINRLRLSAIGIGLIAAGFTMSPQVFAATGVGGGVEIGTASNCSTGASAGKTDSVAVGCDSVADLPSDPDINFYDRGNPDNQSPIVDTGTNFNSTAIGTGAEAKEAGTSLGMHAYSRNLGVALGIQAKSDNVAALAIGPAALATGNTSLALGRQSAATEDFAQAIGNVASATGKGSLAVGHSARAEGYRSIAIGSADIDGASSTGTQSGVVYQTNQQTLAEGEDSIALGSGARSLSEDSVALGTNSTANVAGGAAGYDPTGNYNAAIIATESTTGAVSVGRAASKNKAAVRRQIVNLAAGTNDSDAVNVSQLKGLAGLELDFDGDTGNTVSRKLGEKLTVKGGVATALSDNNIGVVADDTSKTLTVKLAKKLTSLESITINNGGPIISSTGIDMGSNADEEGYPTNTITNLGKGVNGTDAVNLDQLNDVTTDLTDLGFDITADNASLAPGETKDKVKLGETVKYTSADGSIVTTVADNEIDFALGDNLNVGGPGLDGVDGFIGVNGADGQSGIALNGADGTIGLTGPAAIDGVSPTLTMRPEIRPGDLFDDDTDVTRLSYEDGNGDSHTIATLEDDGLRFSGNDNPTVGYVTRNLNKEVQIVGSKTAIGTYSSGNINTIATQDGGIEIQMADSPKFGEVIINAENTGKITGLTAGEDDTDAVNVYQLNQTNSTINQGLDFGGDSGTDVNRKLGQKLTVKGGDTINADPATKNISVTANGADTLTIRLDKDINLGNTGSVTTGNTQVNNAGITLYNGDNDQVALTNNGLNNGNNKITNVADGLLSANSKDAVNGSQLFKTNDEIAKGIYIGDGNSDNDQQFALGDTINVTGDSNITTIASTTGVQVKLNSQLNLSDEGNIQIGNTIMNNTGFTFIGNKLEDTVILGAGGLNNGFNRITNVAAGIDLTDAVTVGQLESATYSLDQGWGLSAQGDNATMVKQGSAVDINSRDGNITISRTLANGSLARQAGRAADVNDISFDLNRDISVDSLQTGDSTMTSDGLTIVGGPSITKAGIDAAGTKITNVMNGDVSESSEDAINGGQLYAQGSGISSIIGGDTVYNPVDGTFTNNNIGGTGENNIDGAIASIKRGEIIINENIQTNTTNIETNTTNIATNTADIVTNTTNIETNTTNIKVNKDKIDAGLNFGADSGANINKPVGDGSVLSFKGGNNITTTAQGSSIKFDLNGNINIDSVTTGNTTINNSGVSIAGGPSMTAAGIYAGNVETGPSMTTDGIYAGGKTITGVADGVAATDAVNISQLSALDSRLNNNMNDLGYKIGEVEDDANAGISAAMAMSSLPQAFIPGKSLIGGGIGTYNGESAVAIGFSKLSNDGRWVMKINGTADTQGNAGGSIGAGFHFD